MFVKFNSLFLKRLNQTVFVSALVCVLLYIVNHIFRGIVEFYFPIRLVLLLPIILFLIAFHLQHNVWQSLLKSSCQAKLLVRVFLTTFVSTSALLLLLVTPVAGINLLSLPPEIVSPLRDITFLVNLVSLSMYYWLTWAPLASSQKEHNWHKLALILIFILFVGIKFFMPLNFTGSFIDEYFHVFSATEYNSTYHFAEFYAGDYYGRGGYVSLLLSLVFRVLGNTILAAKMLPAIMGVINFLLLFRLSRHLIHRAEFRAVLMLVYTLSFWVIFNNFYIRMYVFFEFFLLSSLLILLNVYDLLMNHILKWKKIATYMIAFTLLNLVFFRFSEDIGAELIIGFNALFVVYLILFKTYRLKLNHTLLRPIGFLLGLSLPIKLGLILLAAIPVTVLMGLPEQVVFLIKGSLLYGSDFNYHNLFVNLNPLPTVLFLAGAITLLYEHGKTRIVTALCLFLFTVHIFSAPDLQIERGILYLLPLYYLVSVSTLERLNISKAVLAILLVIWAGLGYLNFPKYFPPDPTLPGEVGYMDYEKAFTFAGKYCKDATVFSLIPHPFIGNFYGVRTDYSSLIQYEQLIQDPTYYFDEVTHQYKTTLLDVPILINSTQIEQLVYKAQKSCLIIHPLVYSRFISNSSFNRITREFYSHKIRFVNVDIYYNL